MKSHNDWDHLEYIKAVFFKFYDAEVVDWPLLLVWRSGDFIRSGVNLFLLHSAKYVRLLSFSSLSAFIGFAMRHSSCSLSCLTPAEWSPRREWWFSRCCSSCNGCRLFVRESKRCLDFVLYCYCIRSTSWVYDRSFCGPMSFYSKYPFLPTSSVVWVEVSFMFEEETSYEVVTSFSLSKVLLWVAWLN